MLVYEIQIILHKHQNIMYIVKLLRNHFTKINMKK